MSDRITVPTPVKGNRPENPVRPEAATEDERPFAEIRKNVLDVVRIITLHRWAFFIPFCVVSCAGFILSLYYPRTYSASTTFERRNDPVIMNLPMSAGAASFSHFRSTMERDLSSIPNIAEAVEHMGLARDCDRDDQGNLTPAGLKQRNVIAASLAPTLSVSKVTPSEEIDIITIKYTGPDPKIGKSLVEQSKRIYVARTMVWIRNFLEKQQEYLTQQSAEAAEQLRIAQRKETELRLENPHVDPTNPGSVLTQLSQLEIERRELDLRRRECETELSTLRQMLMAAESQSTSIAPPALPPPALPASPRAVKLAEQLQAIKQEIAGLRTTRGMTDEHPQIREMTATQRRIEEELDQVSESAVTPSDAEPARASVVASAILANTFPWNSEVLRLRLQVASQETKLSDIDYSIASCRGKTEELRTARQDVFENQEAFAEALNEVAKARQNYSQLESALAAIGPTIRATEQGRLLQFTEGQPARGGAIPVNPKAATVVFLVLLVGAIAGCLTVVLAEVFDHVFRTSGQVARSLGIPILEAIDEIVTTQDSRKRLIHRIVLAPLLFALFAAFNLGSGALAYFSLERPWTYERLCRIPQSAKNYIGSFRLFGGSEQASPEAASSSASTVLPVSTAVVMEQARSGGGSMRDPDS